MAQVANYSTKCEIKHQP